MSELVLFKKDIPKATDGNLKMLVDFESSEYEYTSTAFEFPQIEEVEYDTKVDIKPNVKSKNSLF